MSARRARGFTLLEVVIAVAVTAFIGVTIAISFSTSMKTKDIIEGQAEHYRMLRGAFSRMTREIGAAYVSDRYDAKRYRDAFDRPTNFVGARDRVMFSSLAHQRLYADAKESDQMIVEYSVKTSNEKGANGRSDLIRREKTLLEERMERGGTEDVLFEGLKKLEFQYWNPERKQWEDEWDTRRSDRKSLLPTRVRMTIVAVDESGKEQRYSTQTRVVLNTEFPRFQ
jgi:general secretion pathway protein J